MRLIIPLILVSILSGCVSYTPSVPDDYTGETATIDDSFQRLSKSKANLYYINLINDKKVKNGRAATYEASYDKGLQLIAMGTSRAVPAEPINLHLVGEVYHAVPFSYLLNAGSNYTVEGEVTFTPDAENKYLVNGTLSEKRSAVWIEDIYGNIVSDIVETVRSDQEVVQKSEIETSKKPLKKRVLSRTELFLNISGGESTDLVISKLGKPDRISKDSGNFLTQKPPHFTYNYDGLGEVQFSSQGSKAQFVNKIRPLIKNTDNTSAQSLSLIKSDGKKLQRLAQNYYRRSQLNTETLDLLAEKLWTERHAENASTIDGLAWLCKTLAKSNNPRYRSVLENIASEASAEKLRRYATRSLKLLPIKDTEQFSPTGV